jgi:AcrR family transcriptional regulator
METTHERIVNAARQCFAEKGYGSATIGEIARRAGTAEGTIYRHFAGKKELFMGCLQPAVEEAVQRAHAELQTATSVDALVRGMVENRLRLLEEHRESFDILFTETPHYPELADLLFDQLIMAGFADTATARERLQQSGILKREPNLLINVVGMTAAMWAILHFLRRSRRAPGVLPVPATRAELADQVTTFILYGMAGEGSTR